MRKQHDLYKHLLTASMVMTWCSCVKASMDGLKKGMGVGGGAGRPRPPLQTIKKRVIKDDGNY